MSTTNLNNFWIRTLTGALFVIVIIGSIFLSTYLFAVLFLLVATFALAEFFNIINSGKNYHARIAAGIIAGIVSYISIALVALDIVPLKVLLINLLIPLLIFVNELYHKSETPLINISVTLLGVAYIVVPLAGLNLFFNPNLISGEYHPGVLLGFFVILWANDTFAYLTGMLIGKHKLFKRISPKKTWEGSIGGFIFGLAAAYILSGFYHEFNLVNWLVIAAIISIFGTFGDLAESMLKRSLSIKDSGNILPGHGGLLDRFDAALLAAPAVLVYINLIY